MVLGGTTIEWQWCCCVSVGTAQCYTCLKRSPQHVQSVRKALMPSIHFSKDIHTGHQAQHFTQGSGNGPRGARGRWGEPEIRDLLPPVSSRSDLGVITVHWHCSVCRSKLNALGFDSHSRSLENGGSSVWVEQLPAPSSARGDAFPSTPSSRALCRHKNLEKFPVKAVQSRHLSSRPAFTAQLSVFRRGPGAHLMVHHCMWLRCVRGNPEIPLFRWGHFGRKIGEREEKYCIVTLPITYCQQKYVDKPCSMEKQLRVHRALAGVYFANSSWAELARTWTNVFASIGGYRSLNSLMHRFLLYLNTCSSVPCLCVNG